MGYRVRLRFGNYNLFYKGSSLRFKVGEWVELDEDVALRLKGVQAGIEDKVYPYFDVEEVVEPAKDLEPAQVEVLEIESDTAQEPTKKSKNTKKK